MRHVKSERLKKLEAELTDLEQWLKLGLVPKKDINKHKEEIQTVRDKVDEELERLRFLKESGDIEEFTAPKRQSGRAGYTEMPTLPDIEMAETGGATEGGFDMATEAPDTDQTIHGEEESQGETATKTEETESTNTSAENDDDNYFSEKRRWERGGILDPDADEW